MHSLAGIFIATKGSVVSNIDLSSIEGASTALVIVDNLVEWNRGEESARERARRPEHNTPLTTSNDAKVDIILIHRAAKHEALLRTSSCEKE